MMKRKKEINERKTYGVKYRLTATIVDFTYIVGAWNVPKVKQNGSGTHENYHKMVEINKYTSQFRSSYWFCSAPLPQGACLVNRPWAVRLRQASSSRNPSTPPSSSAPRRYPPFRTPPISNVISQSENDNDNDNYNRTDEEKMEQGKLIISQKYVRNNKQKLTQK